MSEQAVAKKQLSAAALQRLKELQQKEITESAVYEYLAGKVKGEDNRKIMARLSKDELRHYNVWKGYTDIDMKPQKSHVLFHKLMARIFGYTFAAKVMENNEGRAQRDYDALTAEVPESAQIRDEEVIHEAALLKMTKEESLSYIGSIVLGLNDALMELVALLSGITFTLQDTKMAGLAALIVGICSTLAVGATEFLAARSQGHGSGMKAALYTGLGFFLTTLLLVIPYFALPSEAFTAAFICMAVIAVIIIALFNYYVSVVNNFNFKARFFQMLAISTVIGAVVYLVAHTAGGLLGVHL